MKTSIATVSLSGDLSEKLAAAAAAGFDAVEIFENDFLAFDHGPEEVGRMVRDAGLEISLFQPFRDFEGLPEPQRTRAFERAKHKFDTMAALGTDLILICSSVSPLALGGIDRAADDLRQLGEMAAERGIRIGYEALAWGRFVSDHRDAWEIVRRADHPNVGIILDSFHSLSRGIDSNSIRSVPKDKLFLVQMADAPKLDLDLLSWSRHYRNMPGQGDLPVDAFVKAIEATGFDGYYSLEIFNDQFRAGSTKQVAIDGYRSLTYLFDRLDLRKETTLPARAKTSGVAFVEFATDESSAPGMVEFLKSIGFRLAGRHRTKNVELYTQGTLRIVVNSEDTGFAHSTYILRGTNLCAIALKVDDARAALERAEGLSAPSFREPRATGELDLPAIRGVGDSLIYIVDEDEALKNRWEADFDLEAGWDEWPDFGLTAVDHIAQTMRYEDMLSWTLFYTSILDLKKEPAVDVADPGGLVRSQVLKSNDAALRLVLNASQSDRTLSSQFISQFVGPGVHHIAFSTDDMFATMEKLVAAGTRILPIPGNYYDDLEAKFDIDPALLDRMRAAHILYDRDESGEYFQIYLPPVAGGFFVEIVQRRAYSGLGAANAPIRLAAQTRLARREKTAA
ncbi:TIM barrel protein [Mesorhizobium sp. SB112]|uniref:bifunctional sugar phosphate isomerase/epimerase/4-hydroxyphenylpyruvate dioxygenase family protein n=1 Tax=Mesorhizobium sp. SB112 TaxID=3151853 RepID=UPI0032658639